MRDTEGFENIEYFEGGKLRKVEKMDMSSHQCGILKLACGTVFTPVECVFCVKMVER